MQLLVLKKLWECIFSSYTLKSMLIFSSISFHIIQSCVAHFTMIQMRWPLKVNLVSRRIWAGPGWQTRGPFIYYVSAFFYQPQHFHEFFEHSSLSTKKIQTTAWKFRQNLTLKKKFFLFEGKKNHFLWKNWKSN